MNKFAKFQHDAIKVSKDNPVGKWRQLYIDILKEFNFSSILEIGAGSPEFLINSGIKDKTAIDYGSNFKEEFEKNKIKLIQLDLNSDDINNKIIGKFDVIVCSDVFEHIISPVNTLQMIKRNLNQNGILLSHVPNEFRIINMINIMFRNKTSQIFHPWKKEFDDPHVRRFTKKGFLEFLNLEFNSNLYLSDMKYEKLSKLLSFLKLVVPYSLEPGPTYLSTNNKDTLYSFNKIKQKLKNNV